ncbi:MAG: c-type cytochrome [Gammaproteobacteria bacterium]|nr:c-type cytochrome [Gammaproteobacteria bacterium]
MTLVLRSCVLAGAVLCAWLVAAPEARAFEPFSPLPAAPPIPAENPQTPAKVALGRQLFFDPRLSVDGRVSCNSCHDLRRGGADGRKVSTGARGVATARNAPTLWNAAYQTAYFWDGRAASLEEAIAGHIVDPAIMGQPDAGAALASLGRLALYRKQFSAAFGGWRPVKYRHAVDALAAYVRTLVTPGGPFDRYLEGDASALSEAARRGHGLFVEKGCAACHFWVNLAGPVPGLAIPMGKGFYELFPTYRGSRYEAEYGLLGADMGRFHIDGRVEHQYLWRVPTLRNVELTAPYFHNGSVATLEEAVRVMAKTQFDLDVNEGEVSDIVAFLHALTGEFPPPESLTAP